MAKFGIDVDEYAPAGYNDNINAPVRGLSLLHDTGTGSSSGSYGNFESMPVICTDDKAELCPVTLDDRKRKRAKGKDAATPGYFTTTLDNGIMVHIACLAVPVRFRNCSHICTNLPLPIPT